MGGGCSHTGRKQVKRTAIDDRIRSLSHFLVLHPFFVHANIGTWVVQGRGDGGHTHHLFCRSALALSTASMRREITDRIDTQGDLGHSSEIDQTWTDRAKDRNRAR